MTVSFIKKRLLPNIMVACGFLVLSSCAADLLIQTAVDQAIGELFREDPEAAATRPILSIDDLEMDTITGEPPAILPTIATNPVDIGGVTIPIVGGGSPQNGGGSGSATQIATNKNRLTLRQEYQMHDAGFVFGMLDFHARGYFGQGMRIGIFDSPVFPNQPDLNPERVTAFPSLSSNTFDTIDRHGTTVAMIAGASIGAGSYVGVAPSARILTFSQQGDQTLATVMRDVIAVSDVVNFSFSIALRFQYQGAEIRIDDEDIIEGTILRDGRRERLTTQIVERGFSNHIPILLQNGDFRSPRTSTLSGDRTAVVVAAGNSGGSSPEILAGLPYYIPGLRGHHLAVVATRCEILINERNEQVCTNDNEIIAEYSNRCGLAANFCLAAPGDVTVDLIYPDGVDRPTYSGKGTSFATPRVVGALALLGSMTLNDQGERTLTMQELVARLLRTADKEGRYSNSAIYGQGLLDLENALQPQGQTRLALGLNLDGRSVALDKTSILVGQPFGDGLSNAFAQRTITVFDSLDFPFYTSLDTLVKPREPSPLSVPQTIVPAWSQDTSYPQPLSGQHQLFLWFHTNPAPNTPVLSSHLHASAYLSLVPQAVGMGLAVPWGNKSHELRFALFSDHDVVRHSTYLPPSQTSNGYGTALQWTRHHGHASYVSLTSGLIVEDERFLSTQGQGALITDTARTIFVGLSGKHAFHPKWSLEHSMHGGMTQILPAHGSLFQDFTPIWSSEARVELVRQDLWRAGDRLGFGIRQPLRIENGQASVRYVKSRTLERDLVYREFEADMEPSGRSIRFGIHYYTPLSKASFLDLSVDVTRQPQHTADHAPSVSAMLFWQHHF